MKSVIKFQRVSIKEKMRSIIEIFDQFVVNTDQENEDVEEFSLQHAETTNVDEEQFEQEKEQTDQDSEEEEEENETLSLQKLLEDLLNVQKYQENKNKKQGFQECLKPVSSTNRTTTIELALAVFAFINKHCHGSSLSLKALLQLVQICLPKDNSFPKTLTQFTQVN